MEAKPFLSWALGPSHLQLVLWSLSFPLFSEALCAGGKAVLSEQQKQLVLWPRFFAAGTLTPPGEGRGGGVGHACASPLQWAGLGGPPAARGLGSLTLLGWAVTSCLSLQVPG